MSDNKKIIGVIIARQGSSRLPEKALKLVVGKPIIGHLVDRIKASKYITDVVIATSTKKEDDAIEEYGKTINTKVYRGHPEDILDRMYHAVAEEKPLAIVEVGGDCPLVAQELINYGIELFLSNPNADVVTNALVPPFTYPVGYDFILVKFAALEKTHKQAKLTSERYQPFQYMVKNDKEYIFKNFVLEQSYNHWRWTLDYPEDYDFVKAIYEELYAKNPLFGWNEINKLLNEKPQIININKMHVEPVSQYTAWSTGSYVEEVQSDIRIMLDKAKDLDKQRKYAESKEQYNHIHKLIADLIARADSKQ